MKILYKILFEVKVLHEFYLTDPQGGSVFDLAAQPDRIQYLRERFSDDQSPVNEDLIFSLTPDQQALFRSYRMVLLNSYSGCMVAIAVNETKLSDGTVVYTPVVPLPNGLNILIGIRAARDFIHLITNRRMSTPIKAARYFSNEQVFTPKVFPWLSTPIVAFDSSYVYEQGELASYGASDVEAYYYYIDQTVNPPVGHDLWLKISGTSFSGEQDRLVVAPRFTYTFAPADQVTNVVFQLKDANNQLLDTRKLGNAQPLSSVLLDYSSLLTAPLNSTPLNTLPAAPVGPNLLYMLVVTGDNGYSRQVPLIFYQQDTHDVPAGNWGWIQIQKSVTNADLNLLDTNGQLITQTQPNGQQTQHRIYEIWLKSRFTYWRYRNDEGGTLKPPGSDISSMLDLLDGELISKAPRFITYQPTYFKNPNDNSFHFLPNPDPETLSEVDGQQAFSNIPVPDSPMFPIN